MLATIATVKLDKGYGFLRGDSAPDVFFHSSALVDFVFSNELVGQRVECDVTKTSKGPRAENVRPIDSAPVARGY